MAIRYDKSLLQEIRRTVKNYQAKRKRVAEKGGELLPDPAYVSNFLTDYTDRRTLLRELKRLQRYSERGAEEEVEFESGIRLTRYQMGEYKREVMLAKRNLTLQMKDYGDTRNLQPLGRSQYQNLVDRYAYISRPIASLDKRQFEIFKHITFTESDTKRRRKRFYNNIMTMADEITYALPDDVANDFKKAVLSLSEKKLTGFINQDHYLHAIMDWYEIIKAGGNIQNFEDSVINLTDYINAL